MSHIFISYSRKDVDFAQKIVTALAENELDTWIDWKSIPKGEDWEQEIYRGIEEADAFLFLISPHSVQSEMCKKEIAHAVENGKRILPIVVRDADSESIHPEIARRNWIFCREEQDDFSQAIEEAGRTVHTDYEWLKYHTKLQVKALEWERRQDTSRLLRGKELREAEEQLAGAGNLKDPQPTELHRSYVLHSQRNEVRQRRRVTIGLGVVLTIVAILAVFAWDQRNSAQHSESTAVAEANAKATALIEQERARATAQAEVYARATAQVDAEQQRNIAINQNLSLQGQYLLKVSPLSESPAVGSLLLLEAKMREPSFENQPLLDALSVLGKPIFRRQHDDGIQAVAFSPDGQLVASASSDGTLRIWNAATGQETFRLKHEGDVYSAAFSRDGRWLVSGSQDHTARVWDVTTGKEISRMQHDSVIYSAQFSPDSRWVVSGSADGTARVWDAMTAQEVSRVQHDRKNNYQGVYSVAFSSDNKRVVSGGLDCTIRIWDPGTGQEIAHMEHEKGHCWVRSAIFSSDGQWVVSVSRDRTVRVWNALTGQEISRMEINSDSVSSIAVSPDNRWIMAGGYNDVLVWDLKTGEEIYRVRHTLETGWDTGVDSVAFSPNGRLAMASWQDGDIRVWDAATGRSISYMNLSTPVRSTAFSPDGRRVVAGGSDGTVEVFDLQREYEITTLPSGWSVAMSPYGHWFVTGGEEGIIRILESDTGRELSRFDQGSPTWKLAISPDGRKVVAGSEDGFVRVWDVSTGNEVSHIRHPVGITAVLFTPDSRKVVSAGAYSEYMIHVWDAETGQEISHMQHSTHSNVVVSLSVAISPDGRWIASGGTDRTVRIWEVSSGKELIHLEFDYDIFEVAFSPDGKSIISSGAHETTQIRDAVTGEEISHMTHPGGWIQLATFAPNGKWAISGGTDYTVKVWDAQTSQEVFRIRNINIEIAAFSPDGRFLALGDRDGLVTVWDLERQLEVSRVQHEARITSLAFSPDDRWVVSGSVDGVFKMWIWDITNEICSRLPRNLTPAEWNQYVSENIPYHATCPNLPIPVEQN